jgi:hypothetical protein
MVMNLYKMNRLDRFLGISDDLGKKKFKNFCSAERFLTLAEKKTAIYHMSESAILPQQKACTSSCIALPNLN